MSDAPKSWDEVNGTAHMTATGSVLLRDGRGWVEFSNNPPAEQMREAAALVVEDFPQGADGPADCGKRVAWALGHIAAAIRALPLPPDPQPDPRVTALVEALRDALLWTADYEDRAGWRGKARAAIARVKGGE